MSFRQYIHGFYDHIINPPFGNKDIQKELVNLRRKLAKKSLMFYKGRKKNIEYKSEIKRFLLRTMIIRALGRLRDPWVRDHHSGSEIVFYALVV